MLNLRSVATIGSKTTINNCNTKDLDIKKKYFLTIRKHQTLDYVKVSQIDAIMQELTKHLQTLKVCHSIYEVDKKYNQLHYHVIVYIDQYFKYTKLVSINGFRLYWSKVYNINRLLLYMLKQTQTAEEEESNIIINKYTHKKAPNLFI